MAEKLGLDLAVAIKLVNIRPLQKPRPLTDLLQRLPGFQPPRATDTWTARKAQR